MSMHDAYTIGLPILAVLLGILLNQRGLEKLEVRMDKFDGRLDKFEGRLERFDDHLNRMQLELTSRIDRVQADVMARVDRVHADLIHFNHELGIHDSRIDFLMDQSKPKN
jgi:archaellum component FlaC